MSLIFLKPNFTHNIWGGTKLHDIFSYETVGTDIGECWGISAHPTNDNLILNPEYQGMHLSELWNKHPELFGYPTADRFPLLVKIIDAKDDLSIQVHPDDSYAAIHENGNLGKTECWYILDCKADATIICGHTAKTKEEMVQMIGAGQFKEFIREIPISKGDFLQIDPGTVHAIKGGTFLLETQQSSDLTYRVYDYDRLWNGKPRQLHVEKSMDVITVPAKPVSDSVICAENTPSNTFVELFTCDYYHIGKIKVEGNTNLSFTDHFVLGSVIEGTGTVNGEKVKKGDHFIVPFPCENITLAGDLELIFSHTVK